MTQRRLCLGPPYRSHLSAKPDDDDGGQALRVLGVVTRPCSRRTDGEKSWVDHDLHKPTQAGKEAGRPGMNKQEQHWHIVAGELQRVLLAPGHRTVAGQRAGPSDLGDNVASKPACAGCSRRSGLPRARAATGVHVVRGALTTLSSALAQPDAGTVTSWPLTTKWIPSPSAVADVSVNP